MNSLTDQQLLRDYADRRSEAAFAELVRRHVDLVYSAALRMVCDAHLAKDVAQGTFIALAQNAPQLADRPVLSGWLHCTARNLAAKTVRFEVRRRAREQEAAAMNELLSAEPDAVWEYVAPHLDAALGELNEPDRDAVLLRYFERKSASEMAQTLGVSEDAAQKRVGRAVEHLREFLARRGVTVGTGGLVVVLSANAVQAAPVGLAVTISTAAALAGTTLTTTAIAAATKAIAMTAMQKALIAATLVAAVGTGIYEARQASTLRSQVQTLRRQQAPLGERVEQLIRERDEAARQLAALRDETERLNRNTAELLKLRGEAGMLRKQTGELEKMREESRQLRAALDKREPAFIAIGPTNAAEPPQLFTRAFKVGTNSFVSKLKSSAQSQDGEPLPETLRRYLRENGIETEPPAAVYWSDSRGELLMRNTLTNLDKFEMLLINNLGVGD